MTIAVANCYRRSDLLHAVFLVPQGPLGTAVARCYVGFELLRLSMFSTDGSLPIVRAETRG